MFAFVVAFVLRCKNLCALRCVQIASNIVQADFAMGVTVHYFVQSSG
ncbi:hypothetical protein BLL52_4319 [Rhodoferax antarcticus ANT.BR]|uniref:Uncharacterized protein n=1 Tax=Rhodoferax antarcticus ANT.BR TaxID=1111071 RepID=A0A1Q8Y9C6_9BURK|nr:hypothetical protein BLL52_4319 [Rhodoferax antarcticus ANT.BR]